jgi:hypothetical protein
MLQWELVQPAGTLPRAAQGKLFGDFGSKAGEMLGDFLYGEVSE